MENEGLILCREGKRMKSQDFMRFFSFGQVLDRCSDVGDGTAGEDLVKIEGFAAVAKDVVQKTFVHSTNKVSIFPNRVTNF